VKYSPGDGVWTVSESAAKIKDLKEELGDKEYDAHKKAIQNFLCAYFSTGSCNTSQGDSINPLGASTKGGKILKVRWALPGAGKSGGLRIIVVVYCDEKKVVLAEAFKRRTDPTPEEVADSVTNL